MSDFNELEQYKKRKDLSKTAQEEIVVILCKLNNTEDKMDILKEILNFPQAVLGKYLINTFKNITEEDAKKLLDFSSKIEPVKYGHLFRMYASLMKLNAKAIAIDVLFVNMDENYLGEKINKQIFIGLDKAIKECGIDCFIIKLDENKTRQKNIFASFLAKYAEYSKVNLAQELFIKFHEVNGLKILDNKKVEVVKVNNEKEVVVSKKEKFNIKNILAEVADNYDSLENKIKRLEGDKCLWQDEKKKLLLQVEQCNKELENLSFHKEQLEQTKVKLLKSIEELEKERVNLILKDKETTIRLQTISSGYDVAGKQEIDEMKGILSKKLASVYGKYLEIKDKEQDIVYYDMLLLMLDEVFKKLKKNGINL